MKLRVICVVAGFQGGFQFTDLAADQPNILNWAAPVCSLVPPLEFRSSARNGARADSLVGFTYLSGGECLLCQFSIEVLLLFSYVLFVAARVDERVCATVFQARIFFL